MEVLRESQKKKRKLMKRTPARKYKVEEDCTGLAEMRRIMEGWTTRKSRKRG